MQRNNILKKLIKIAKKALTNNGRYPIMNLQQRETRTSSIKDNLISNKELSRRKCKDTEK